LDGTLLQGCRLTAILGARISGNIKEVISRLFSGAHTRSPVSLRALGECNAIRSRGASYSELTFASTLKTEFVNKDAIVAVLHDCRPDQSSAVISGLPGADLTRFPEARF
jgi:hypothetical protein